MSEYIEVGQPLQFTDPNTPTRVGEIVENVSDIYNIPSPRLGMQVFVKSEKKSFVITSLKSKVISGVDVPEAAVEAFEPVGAKSFTWNNDTNQSNMNDFVVAGVYDIKGERKRTNDNLPILNTGGGHTFNARLTVLDSSIERTEGEPQSDDKCITQVLSFSNRLGQGEVYIRTGKGVTLNSLTWENWSTLQRNVNVGSLDSKVDLKKYIDNGIYSGVFKYGSADNDLKTFVMVVINDYAIGLSPRRVSQFLYSIDKATGEVSYETQTCEDETWKGWEILNKSEIDSMIEAAIADLIGTAPDTLDTLQEIAEWVLNHQDLYGTLKTLAEENTKKINDEIKRSVAADQDLLRSIDEEVRRATEAEEATDKKIATEIEKLKDGDTIVGQAREIHSRNGKTVPDSFLARTTAGSGTIGDGVASLKSVGGNIVKNLVDGTFESGWQNYNNTFTTASIDNNIIFLSSTNTKGVARYRAQVGQDITGHIYYQSCFIKCSVAPNVDEVIIGVANAVGIVESKNTYASAKSTTDWQLVSVRYQGGINQNNYRIVNIFDKRKENWGTISVYKYQYIDLTEMFGVGNEPDQATCDRLFGTMDALSQGLTIANPATFKSTGFNQFNPDNVLEGKAISNNAIVSGDKKIAIIPCLPCKVGIGENNGYCIHGEFGGDIKVYLTPLNPMEVEGELYMHELTKDATTDTYMPLIKGYMLIEVPTTANLCAHFLWSEDKCERDTYEPYFESKVELPDIPQMSEWGLAGIQPSGNPICDEIDFVKGVYRKKIGAVDMGSLNYSYNEANNVFILEPYTNKGFDFKGGGAILASAYTTASAGYADSARPDKTIYAAYNKILRIHIKDSSYTDATSLKASLQGVMLYYELATPEEYPLSKVDNNYISSDYGVEQFDSVVPCNANNLYYMRSLAGETRNFLDRMYANTGKDESPIAVADYITSGIEGNKELVTVLNDSKKEKVKIVQQSDFQATINPNVFYLWGTVSTLEVELGDLLDGEVSEYMFQFTSGATATTLILPDTIQWMVKPNIQPNKTYQVSIINNLGVIGEFSNE